jgi:hypothetical protein
MTQTHCPACTHPWTEHPGLAATCVRLQNALWEVERLNATLKRQASSYRMALDAAKGTAYHDLQEAQRLHAECGPESLESERAANAVLTGEVERLRRYLETQRNAFIVTAQSANLTTRKARELMSRGYEVSGVVLIGPDNRRAIVEMSAVRCISNSEMWALMHPATDPLPEGEGSR